MKATKVLQMLAILISIPVAYPSLHYVAMIQGRQDKVSL